MADLDLQPLDDEPLDLQPVDDLPPSRTMRMVRGTRDFLNARVPGYADLKDLLHQESEGEQATATGAAERKAQERGSTLAGVVEGAPGVLRSTVSEFASGFVPATVKDMAFLMLTEGAGRALPSSVGKVGRAATGAGIGAGVAYLAGAKPAGIAESSLAGAVAGVLGPAAKKKLETVLPPTEAEQAVLASAKELGVKPFLDQVQDSPMAGWVGNLLRTHPETAAEMRALDTARAQTITRAKTELLDAMGPGGSAEALGGRVQREAGDRLAALDAERGAAYREAKTDALSPYPTPAYPEEASAQLRGAIEGRGKAALRKRGSLYDAAYDALPSKPTEILVAEDAPVAAAKAVMEEEGLTAAGRRNKAFRIAQDIATGGADRRAAVKAAGAVLDAAERETASQLANLSKEGLLAIERDPRQAALLAPELQAALRDRGLAAARKEMGDLALLQSRPDLLAKLAPEEQAQLAQAGQMSLAKLNKHIDDLKVAIDEVGRTTTPNSAGRNTGGLNPVGRQLFRLKNAMSGARDLIFEQYPAAQARKAEADVFHSDVVKGVFRNKNVVEAYNKDPMGVFRRVAASGDADAAKLLAAAVGPRGKPVLQHQLVELILESPKAIPTEADLAANLIKYAPVTRALLTAPEQATLRAFAKTGDLPVFMQTAYEGRLRDALTRRPQAVVAALTSGEGDKTLARAIKRYSDPETFQRLGRMIADDILTPSAHAPEAGNAGIMTRVGKYSPAFLETFFGPERVRAMKRVGLASELLPGFGDLAKAPQSPNPGARLTQAGLGIKAQALANTMLRGAGGILGEGAMFLVGRDQLVKMYTEPQGQLLLSTMLRLPALDPRWPLVLRRAAQGGYLQVRADTLKPAFNMATGRSQDRAKIPTSPVGSEPDERMGPINGLKPVYP